MDKKPATGARLILGYVGIFFVLTGIIVMIPLLLIPFLPLIGTTGYSDALWFPAFLIPGLALIGLGILLYMLFLHGRERSRLGRHQDSLLLVLVWLVAIFGSLLPFIFRNIDFFGVANDGIQFSFVSSLFETTSGYCTIGLTTFTPNMLNPEWSGYYLFVFYRAVLLFIGGIGLVLVITSALSDRYGLNLYKAEGHNDQLFPNLGRSAKIIFGIYIVYILLGTLAYMLAGMSFFDAFTTSISAVSTGGFTPHAESIAYYELYPELAGGFLPCNYIAIEIISCVLMVLGATNFLTHFFLFRFKFKKVFNDIELKLLLILTCVFVPLIIGSIYVNVLHGIDFWTGVRYSVFHFFSIATTTGFSNIDPTQHAFYSFNGSMIGGVGGLFTQTSLLLFIILMFIGGGSGSTAGGAKLQRIAYSLKGIYWNIRERISPKELILPRQVYRHGKIENVSDSDLHESNSMIMIYLVICIVGSLLLSFINSIDLQESMFQFLSAFSSTGLSLPYFTFKGAGNTIAHNISMVVLSISMLLGRLEVLPFIFAGQRVAHDIFGTKI